MVDLQNRSAEVNWDSAFQVIDARATLFGVHVSNADLEPWLGFTQPIFGQEGWIRGEEHVMTACVIDTDHNNETERPTILVDGVELTPPVQSSFSGEKTCYETTWTPETGGDLQPVSVVLLAGDVEWSNRSLNPFDLPPIAELHISEQNHLDGGEDQIFIVVIDPDDPDIEYDLNSSILWPGAGLQLLEE